MQIPRLDKLELGNSYMYMQLIIIVDVIFLFQWTRDPHTQAHIANLSSVYSNDQPWVTWQQGSDLHLQPSLSHRKNIQLNTCKDRSHYHFQQNQGSVECKWRQQKQSVTDGQTDRWTNGQSDPFEAFWFTGATIIHPLIGIQIPYLNHTVRLKY